MDGNIIIGIGGLVVGLGSALLVFIKGRGENKNKNSEIKSAIDARIDARMEKELKRVYDELDKISKAADRRAVATGNILRDLATQWVGPPPLLNPADIAELTDTIPAQWIHRKDGPIMPPPPLPKES